MSYWENDSFVIFLSPLKQSRFDKMHGNKFTFQSGLDEKNYVQI